MTTLNDLQIRVGQVLDDTEGARFTAALLTEAMRLTLDKIDQRQPRILCSEISIDSDGRDLLLPELPDCQYLVDLSLLRSGHVRAELEPGGEFSYQFEGQQVRLHFSGLCSPKSGDRLRISYAARYTIEGLDDAEVTTLPGDYESALVNGAAGQACLLRASGLAETYGTRPEEITRLLELGELRLAEFDKTLGSIKVLHEFGFPPGFCLDKWDTGSEF